MPESLLANLRVFARTLRAAGVAVRAGGVPDAVRALAEVGLSSRRDVRDALRAVLVSRREDLGAFDRLFDRGLHFVARLEHVAGDDSSRA